MLAMISDALFMWTHSRKINGKVHYIDPQTGNADVSNYFKKMKNGKTAFWRIDDATIDENYLKYICKREGG